MDDTRASPSLASQVTLSVVSHGHGPLLERLLADLSHSEDLRGVTIIVTLNLAEEDFEPRASSLDVKVRRNARPRGFGANHNQAFADCHTPWFAILNPDLRLPDPSCIRQLLEASSRHADVALVAPRVVNSLGAVEDSIRPNLTPASILRRRLRRNDPVPASDVAARRGAPFYWLAGMFMLVRSDAFRAVGGFDERLFLYCEDYDLCARLYRAGHALTQYSEVSVVHDAQRDSHRSSRHLKLHLTSLLKVWSSAAFWDVCWIEWRRRWSAGRRRQANSGTSLRR